MSPRYGVAGAAPNQYLASTLLSRTVSSPSPAAAMPGNVPSLALNHNQVSGLSMFPPPQHLGAPDMHATSITPRNLPPMAPRPGMDSTPKDDHHIARQYSAPMTSSGGSGWIPAPLPSPDQPRAHTEPLTSSSVTVSGTNSPITRNSSYGVAADHSLLGLGPLPEPAGMCHLIYLFISCHAFCIRVLIETGAECVVAKLFRWIKCI